jgi:hypothetical protein
MAPRWTTASRRDGQRAQSEDRPLRCDLEPGQTAFEPEALGRPLACIRRRRGDVRGLDTNDCRRDPLAVRTGQARIPEVGADQRAPSFSSHPNPLRLFVRPPLSLHPIYSASHRNLAL